MVPYWKTVYFILGDKHDTREEQHTHWVASWRAFPIKIQTLNCSVTASPRNCFLSFSNFMVQVSITHDWLQLYLLSRICILNVSISWFRSQSLMIDFHFTFYREFTFWSFQFCGSGFRHSWLYLPLDLSHSHSAQ